MTIFDPKNLRWKSLEKNLYFLCNKNGICLVTHNHAKCLCAVTSVITRASEKKVHFFYIKLLNMVTPFYFNLIQNTAKKMSMGMNS